MPEHQYHISMSRDYRGESIGFVASDSNMLMLAGYAEGAKFLAVNAITVDLNFKSGEYEEVSRTMVLINTNFIVTIIELDKPLNKKE